MKFSRVLQSKGFGLPVLATASFNLATHNAVLMSAAFKPAASRCFSSKQTSFSESEEVVEERRPPRREARERDDRRERRDDRTERRGDRLENNRERSEHKYTTDS